METRVSKSSFLGIKGAKKERKLLEESSTSYLGSRCREFESPHSDQSIQIRTFYQLVKGSDLLFISDVEFRGGLIVSPPRIFALKGTVGRSGAFAAFG